MVDDVGVYFDNTPYSLVNFVAYVSLYQYKQ